MGELEVWDYIGNLWKVERDQELVVTEFEFFST
jgi:hypothetical protein